MSAHADSLRDLHVLHQRAKALRDRLASGPKTLATRQAVLATRQAALDAARKAVVDAKAQAHKRETQLKGQQAKSEELRTRLNTIKKQVEYDAIRNQLAHDNLAMSKLSDEILESLMKVDDEEAAVRTLEGEVKALADEVARLKAEIDTKTAEQRAQLAELEAAVSQSEAIIPADQRDQYRRAIAQRAADALAPVEGSACSGCFVSVTAQMMNELINGGHLVFCKSCGRALYLAEEDRPNTRRTAR